MHTHKQSLSTRYLYGTLLGLVVLAIAVPPSLHYPDATLSKSLLRYLVGGLILASTCTIMYQLHRAGIADETRPADRRRSIRFAMHACALLTIIESSMQLPVTVVDLSEGGLRALAFDCVPEGTVVSIRYDEQLIFGEVCYCCPLATGFAIGVHFQHVLDRSQVTELVSQLSGTDSLDNVQC